MTKINLKKMFRDFKIQRNINKDIKDISAWYTKSHRVWSYKGTINKTRQYYKDKKFNDNILLNRLFRLRNNVDDVHDTINIFLGIMAGLLVNEIGFFTSLIDNFNKTVADKMVEVENVEHLAQINRIKTATNVKFYLLIFGVLVITILVIKFITNILKSRNGKRNCLEQKELEIIMDILEGKKELT